MTRDWQIIRNTVGTLCWEFKGIIKYFVILFCAKTILQKGSTHAVKCMFGNLNLFSYVTMVTKAMPEVFFFCINFISVLNYILFLFWRNHCNGLCVCMSLDFTLFCTVPDHSFLTWVLLQLHALIIMGIDTLNREECDLVLRRYWMCSSSLSLAVSLSQAVHSCS